LKLDFGSILQETVVAYYQLFFESCQPLVAIEIFIFCLLPVYT